MSNAYYLQEQAKKEQRELGHFNKAFCDLCEEIESIKEELRIIKSKSDNVSSK